MSERTPRSAAPFSLLYPILDVALESETSLADTVFALARAGCRLLQLRAKRLGPGDFYRWASKAVAAGREANVLVLVNDRVDVALLAGAAGVHLGQDDLSPEAARRLLGEDAILGLSTHTVEQARKADGSTVDYVAIGPVFATDTKAHAGEPLGVAGVGAVRAVVEKPLVAIGGITLERAPALLETGVDGLAVISALRSAVSKDASLEDVAREWLSLKKEAS